MTKLTDAAVVAQGVEKTYAVAESGSRDAKSFMSRISRNTQFVHAVKQVDLVVRAGESVGLIGQNGSGKSTLLRLIAGAEPVTQGKMLVSSRPTLLGVTPALQAYLSGRQNVILGCLALGMNKQEAEELEPEISDWADIGDAIDRPMVTYSAGQRSRLNFAISTAVHPEILLVDEALSTGDGAFVNKAKVRMQSLLSEAGTLFLVSHSLSQIAENCHRAVWMHDGCIISDGKTDEVLSNYRDWITVLGKAPEKAIEILEEVSLEYLSSKPTLTLYSEPEI